MIESTLLHMSSAVFGYSIIILAYTMLNNMESKEVFSYVMLCMAVCSCWEPFTNYGKTGKACKNVRSGTGG